jgi:hypothetical protein
MPTDEDALAELRQANAHKFAEIQRRLKALEIADIEQRIKALEDRVEAKRVLRLAILNLPVGAREDPCS